jgi:hypothetical protein
VREVEGAALRQNDDLRDATTLVKRLTARVEWLERNIRLQPGAAEAVLDAVGPGEAELARVAEEGNAVRSTLLTPSGRDGLRAAVDAHADAVGRVRRSRGEALQACEALASSEPGGGRHTAAATQVRAAAEDLRRARQEQVDRAGAAVDARRRLAADEEARASLAEELAEGERAADELDDVLRSRVAEAVGTGALLPTWFTSVLGPIPPAADTRPWMDAATALLAYRVTYRVTDPILALGPEPAADAGHRRRSWHEQLRRRFRELH